MKNWKPKAKIIAMLVVSFVVFATTLFAVAQNKNSNSLFLDSDQDGLTDQEERAIGTDPYKADTDGDGYSDGKEVESGYNPLKPAPGDQIIVGVSSQSSDSGAGKTENGNDQGSTSNLDLSNPDLFGELAKSNVIGNDIFTNVESDPNNPNLTNEMIGQLMQLMENKLSSSDGSSESPSFDSSDFEQIAQNALQATDIENDLPEIPDSELNILPEIKSKKLSDDEIKEKQKEEIEKYLAQTAFVLASNSPFAVENTSSLETDLNKESTNLITALTTGDTSKVDDYAEKAQTGIDQLKKVEVPYILKDIHKSVLQLAIYTLDLRDDITLNTDDPMKSLVAASSLTAVAENATKLQSELSQILNEYGIESISFP